MSAPAAYDHYAHTHAAAFAPTGGAWSAGEITAQLASPLAFLTGSEQAFAIGRVVAGEAELLTLAVHPDVQGQGLGRAQLTAFEAEARARGATQAFLEVAEDNTAARALYAKAGYTELSRRARYYARPAAPSVDALVLIKPLA